MTRTLRYLLLFVLIGFSGSAFAQEISGRVLDEKKEPLPSAAVQVYQGGILKGGNITDYDGNYTIKPLDPGYYDVLVLYTGYDSILVTNVVVSPGDRTSQNFTMAKPKGHELATVTVKAYKKPLVDIDKPASHILTKDEIAEVPTTQVADLVSLTPGAYQQKRGATINVGGGRTTGNLYVIDGVQVQELSNSSSTTDMAQGSIDQLEVISSGIPAKYGDVSGGVINITSRSSAEKFTGNVRLQHSIDGYNNNLASFSVAGPILKTKVKGDEKRKKTVLGFALSGDYYDDNNRYPDYYEQYEVKPSVMKQLEQNPLRIVSDNSGAPVYNLASDYITMNDLQQVRITPRDATKEARLNGKLDYQATDNIHIIAGGTFDDTKLDYYDRQRDLFAPGSIPVQYDVSGRGFLRFTQKFGKSNDTTHSIISNAYYILQGDYQTTNRKREDPNFKSNIFEYNYVGKFTEDHINTYAPAYLPAGFDSLTGKRGTVLTGANSTGISFQRSELNPILANYTTEIYNSLNGNKPLQLTQLQAVNGMANGDDPQFTYSQNGTGLFYSPGTTQPYYYRFNSNQYALTVDASFDLLLGKTKHAIGFGLYYQQRIERQYVAYANTSFAGTNSLWQQMRQLVSSVDNGNLKLDKLHPVFVVNGVRYNYSTDANKNPIYTDPNGNRKNIIPGPSDTILYNYQNIGNTTFDQNLRKKLGLNSTADINIDALDPSTFSLDMFSADELLNSGHPFINYSGYTYTGGAQAGNVNFNDFWTAKDKNGNYTRPIGAFTPNYIAGYIMDAFNYKDVHFNIGVRVDRYSANTKVLKDPYSEIEEKTVSEVPGSANLLNGGTHPSNIGGNYVVYVDDNSSSSPNIIGYRSGNNWYDPTGKFINDPGVLKQYSGGRDPQPYLVKNTNNAIPVITDSSFNPNTSFTDYTPQVTVQPRVSFSFPISDVADFYAHYDIYSQRPTGQVDATAADYYYLQQNSSSIINNANLLPTKTFDYEVGFQQKLSSSSALTITGFYKERKNMVTLVPYLYAWPTTYYTYGNRDFSTTKGTTLFYDLRATNHIRMSISYTLQFAEGTGSTPTSTNGGGAGQIQANGLLQSFIEAGQPNLRYVTPLDYDSRHNIVADIDYRLGEGEGPIVGGMNILQNAGLHLIPRARSGEPYTRFTDALGNTVIGGVAGSRLPWHYGVDLRLDKDFALSVGKRHKDAVAGVKPKRPLYVKAILQVNNLLQTRDILGVYGYTGKPGDDGYLSSSYGQQYVPQQINPQSFSDLYSIYKNDPTHYNYARTISIALDFNF